MLLNIANSPFYAYLIFSKASSQLVLTHGFIKKLQGEVNCCSMKTWPDDKDNMLTALEILVRLSLCHHSLQTFFSTRYLIGKSLQYLPQHVSICCQRQPKTMIKKSSYNNWSWLASVWSYKFLLIFGLKIIYQWAWLYANFNVCIVRVLLLADIHIARWVVSYFDCSSVYDLSDYSISHSRGVCQIVISM